MNNIFLLLCVAILITLVALGTTPAARTFVSMTTVPERLGDPWFETVVLKPMLRRLTNEQLLLQVPPTTHSGIPYVVPQSILTLQSPRFDVRSVGKDEGPITKLLPALRDPTIRSHDIVIIVDDDIVYKPDVFALLAQSVRSHPRAISCMCNGRIEGFKAYAFRKCTLSPLAKTFIPETCFRIDDDVVAWYARKKKIRTVPVPYSDGDDAWTCSMNQSVTDTHPAWPELMQDAREQIVKRCVADLEGPSHLAKAWSL